VAEAHGTKKVTLEDERTAEAFTGDLRETVESDMQEIRETEFSPTHPISVSVVVDGHSTKVMAAVDQLGRIHLPYRRQFQSAASIRIGDEPTKRVMKVEPRYQNDNPVAWVCYLE